jgi:branched-chain amino acid aminotransferase
MPSLAWTEDQGLVPVEEATVPVLDRGFLYGDSVYETMRAYAGRIFKLEAHLDRLRRSADGLGIAIPWSHEELRVMAADIVDRSRAGEALVDTVLRLIVSRGAGRLGLGVPDSLVPRRIFLAQPLRGLGEALYRDGVAVHLVDRDRSTAIDPELKTGNYLSSVLALREASRLGAHEAFFVNAQGEVVEGTSSNLFMVSGGQLSTPPREAGLLPGITRSTVLDLAHEAGIPTSQVAIQKTALLDAEEAFLSSSLRELVPVVEVDDHVIGTGQPGPITRELLARYRAMACPDRTARSSGCE